jgi:F-box-like
MAVKLSLRPPPLAKALLFLARKTLTTLNVLENICMDGFSHDIINQLPPELLAAILMQTEHHTRNLTGFLESDFQGPLYHVCWRWRQLLLDDPRFWSSGRHTTPASLL